MTADRVDPSNATPRADAVLESGVARGLERRAARPRIALLTGVTGFLGANLLCDLLRCGLEVRCLVRAASPDEARARVHQALSTHALADPGDAKWEVVVGDLAKPRLDMPAAQFTRLSEESDVIYHAGARMSLMLPYRALRAPNVCGTHEMLRLACCGPASAFHHVSSLVVLGDACFDAATPASEAFAVPEPAGASGYTVSKWAAEAVVADASARGLPTSIYRPGRIAGHSVTGACNVDDEFSLMLIGCMRARVAPRIDAVMHLTPVDVVSRGIVGLSRHDSGSGRAFHLMNPAPISWDAVTELMMNADYATHTVPFAEWRSLVARTRRGDEDPVHDRLSVLIARERPPFSLRRRYVSDAAARAALGSLDYPSDLSALVLASASFLAAADARGRIDAGPHLTENSWR